MKSLTSTSDVEGNSAIFAAVMKKGDEDGTFTAAMLGVEPETLVYSDVTKRLPQFSGFRLTFRCIMNMKEDEVDEKVHNPTSNTPLFFSFLTQLCSVVDLEI